MQYWYIIIWFSFLAISCGGVGDIQPRPSILLIMCDDLGWGDVGFNGNQIIQTPHLDQLAFQGLRFNRFYTASPVCSPTRASCLTGRSPYRMGIPTANAGHLKVAEITIPELLKENGYATGHFGKWHLGTLTTKIKDANRGNPGDSSHYSIPSMHGYDTWFVTESKVPTFDPMIKPVRFDSILGESLRYGWKRIEQEEAFEDYGTKYWEAEETYSTESLSGENSRVIMDRVIPFIEKAVDREQPFFSAIWLHTPHLPVVTDSAHAMLYPDASFEEQLYFGAITAMDQQIGRLYTRLQELGIDDQTMIWFASDNGPERDTPGSAGPFRERKRSLYEGGIRVPAFLHWPEVISPGQSDFPICTHDYLPTILDYLDIPYPDDRPLDGMNVSDAFHYENNLRQKSIGFQFGQKKSWMTHQYKLISTDEGKTYELFDLLNDPEEQINIINNHPQLTSDLKSDLNQWITSCKQSNLGKDYQ